MTVTISFQGLGKKELSEGSQVVGHAAHVLLCFPLLASKRSREFNFVALP